MKYEENQVYLLFSQDVSYEIDGKMRTLEVIKNAARDENLEVRVSVREAEFAALLYEPVVEQRPGCFDGASAAGDRARTAPDSGTSA